MNCRHYLDDLWFVDEENSNGDVITLIGVSVALSFNLYYWY